MHKLYKVLVFAILVFGVFFLSYGIYGAVKGYGSYFTNILNGIIQIMCFFGLVYIRKSKGKW